MWNLPEKYKRLWNDWEVRGFITCSLMLQVFLILSASFRKRNAKVAKYVGPFIWFAYLVADAVATFALGLLSDSVGDSRKIKSMTMNPSTNSKNKINDLLAFWGPFLLLHLGGPETITAFALEDNELWLRHLFWLVVEFAAAGYVFMQSLPDNTLLIPTLLMFVAGTIRYAERTYALYLASNDGFKSSIPKTPDPGTNYVKLIEEYTLNKDAGIPTSIEIPEEYQPVVSVVADDSEYREKRVTKVTIAHEFFTTFKRLITDLLLSFNERKQSRDYFLGHSARYSLHHSAKHAFTIMDIELGFAYDILYTKAAVVHTRKGYASRAICFSFILISLLMFHFLFQKHEIHEADIIVTYALLGSAVILEFIALVKLIFSNWTFVNHPVLRPIAGIIANKRRLSIHISQFNLINSCLTNHKWNNCTKLLKENISQIWCINKILDNLIHTSYEIVNNELMEFIFEELKKKSQAATDVEKTKDMCSCRGSRALKEIYDKFRWTVEVEFEESILLWHIATDLCCYSDTDKTEAVPISVAKRRHVSKLISEYMLSLLVLHPLMISSMEGVREIKYRDACEEAMSVLKNKNIGDGENKNGERFDIRKELISLSSEMHGDDKPIKMVLFDACRLAMMLNDEKMMRKCEKWEIISEVWAEMLSYAASHCRGYYHAKGLSRGGELLT